MACGRSHIDTGFGRAVRCSRPAWAQKKHCCQTAVLVPATAWQGTMSRTPPTMRKTARASTVWMSRRSRMVAPRPTPYGVDAVRL